MKPKCLRYFHAGALFTLSELTGNALMAEAISQQSGGRYQAILPQDLENESKRAQDIRDADLAALLSADVALFHFDGTDLDSGTVVEFMVAKFADIPAVILRSDFRRAGDSHSDPWNLMVSDYPRSSRVVVHAMEIYRQQRRRGKSSAETAARSMRATARQIIQAFDEVRKLEPLLPADINQAVHRWINIFTGTTLVTRKTARN